MKGKQNDRTQPCSPLQLCLGSGSDWPFVKEAVDTLARFGVRRKSCPPSHTRSARNSRKPRWLADEGDCARAERRTWRACWRRTTPPVIGIPMQSSALNGLNSAAHCANAGGHRSPRGHRQGGRDQRRPAGGANPKRRGAQRRLQQHKKLGQRPPRTTQIQSDWPGQLKGA